VKLLVTRPAPDGERTAKALRAQGHTVLLAPLTRIAPIKADFGPGPWAALLITSANAVRVLENHPQRQRLSGLPVLAVGDRTAEAAREAGFSAVASAGGTSKELISLANSRYGGRGQPLLWLAGADRAGDLAAAGAPVEIRVVYQAVADLDLTPEAEDALRDGSLDAVLHFSRRSAAAYTCATAKIGLAAPAILQVHCCLSAAVAEPLTAAGATRVRISPRPTEQSLLQLVDSL
jgi:uroporphyrinogen-III synthase